MRSTMGGYLLRRDGELMLCTVILKSTLYFADEPSMSYQDAAVV
jgi:hypothetical protein